MKKIIIDFCQGKEFSFKCNEDAISIAKQYGYELHLLQICSKQEFLSHKKDNILRSIHYHLKKIKPFIQSVCSIPKKSQIVLIYPIPFGFLTKFFCFCLKQKKCKITMLCIDVNCFRGLSSCRKDTNNLNAVDSLILHTPNMAKACQEIHIKTPSDLIYLFDYLTDDLPSATNGLGKMRIAFAGNFSKAPFIYKLTSLSFFDPQTCFYLYGSKDERLKTNEKVQYKGRFSPEKISELHADWGLVWDGDSLENCEGQYGEYLKMNSPHKTSLYVAANLPIIISEKAGLASFIEENKLGITVKSIYEIEDKILNLSQMEEEEIRNNVKRYSEKIRRGEILTSLLSNI